MPVYKKKDEHFFKTWTPKMAYVFGFVVADGSVIKNKRGAHFLDIQSTDKEILYKIRTILRSNLKISSYHRKNKNWKTRYRLQVGSKEIFYNLVELGVKPRKSKTITMPLVPKKYFSHFLRGYFDGDGNVNFGIYKRRGRKKRTTILIARFTSGSRDFLIGLLRNLRKCPKLKGGSISQKKGGFDLIFSIKDGLKLYHFMYGNVSNNLFLKRKYLIFKKALKYF